MSFHPNDVARRGRYARVAVILVYVGLTGAFFRTQVLQHAQYVLQSETNRLREVPLPAPRGTIYDRNGKIIAENLPGYSVSILSSSVDSLRQVLSRLAESVQLTPDQIEIAVRRYRRSPNRPAVILADAPFDVVSVLEEHRIEFPGLIIQASPKRYYPDGPAVASFVGYTGEITEKELTDSIYRVQGYKAGQQIGKSGLEKQYETRLRGREGTRFVEVDARGRVVREAGARQDILPEMAPDLHTNIDLDLQKFVANMFGDSLQGGVIALDPNTGAVLAMHSAPTFDPNKFIGGIPGELYKTLLTDPRRPLYNKVIQGKYPPGSTFKLATVLTALQAGVVGLDDHMPTTCTGGYWFGSRYFKCWDKRGHGSVSLVRAIEVSCDVYFYQLGLKIGLSRLIAGGMDLSFRDRTGIDLPEEGRPLWPENVQYFNQRYGPRGWTQAVSLNLAIGQGENSQTVANMAKFYAALATGGEAATPEIMKGTPKRVRIFKVTDEQMFGLRAAMANVVSARGTANSARIEGTIVAGKTGTAQNSEDPTRDHAWFVGFAPADKPTIVVAVMLEFGGHGWHAAQVATRVMSKYLKVTPIQLLNTEG